MYSEDPPGVTAMGPYLLAEAGGVSDAMLWELLQLHPGAQWIAQITYSRNILRPQDYMLHSIFDGFVVTASSEVIILPRPSLNCTNQQ